MKINNIFRKIASLAGFAALLCSAAMLPACNDDETTGAPYIRLENIVATSQVSNASDRGFDINPMVGSVVTEIIRYDVRSNTNWTIDYVSDDAEEWLKIFPRVGSGDGKVRFTVVDNDNTEPRNTVVIFRYANGRQAEVTLSVTQMGNEPHITVYVNSVKTNDIVTGRKAQTYDIQVVSSVDYFYTPEKSDWATFTEVGNGYYTLSLEAYPETPTTLDRSNLITFKGVGEFASVVKELNILQTIAPELIVSGKDLEKNEEEADTYDVPEFEFTGGTFSFNVQSNWGWTVVKENPEDKWYTVSPAQGVADKASVVTITVNKNTESARQGIFTIETEEVLGVKAVKTFLFEQEGGGGGSIVVGPIVGLEAPVAWFFDGAAENKTYPIPTSQFVTNNALLSVTETGVLSYYHSYEDQTGTKDPDCIRYIGGSGQPYVSGAWPGDYWQFEIPVKDIVKGAKVQFSSVGRISATGHRYWRLEFQDGTGNRWQPMGEEKTATVSGQEITYTHDLVIVPNVTNTTINGVAVFSRAIPDGYLRIRFRCMANYTGENKVLANPNGGTVRFASSETAGYNDSPKIMQIFD